MAEVYKKPFEHPAPGCKPAPAAALTADQQTKYSALLKTVSSWESLPTTTAKSASTTPLSDTEKLWLTRECLLRYLRAVKWASPAAAEKRLRDTLIWRREYGVEGFTADFISPENATGKQVLFGFDNQGRPCLYLLPNKQNTPNSPKQVQHLVFMLEQTLSIAPPGQESLALLIDFRNSSSSSNPSVGTGRQVLSILQNHYPERLGRALITHLPWYVTIFLKAVSPFIDPVTKTKMVYNEPLEGHVPKSQLMKNAGGECEFVYEHDVYWPALNELADKRRGERVERWRKVGGRIGESEVYLWGGEEGGDGVEKKVDAEVSNKEDEADKIANGVASLDVKDEKEKENVIPAPAEKPQDVIGVAA